MQNQIHYLVNPNQTSDYYWFANCRISCFRKPIETVFSSLKQFEIECF